MLLGANGILWIGANEGLICGLPRTWQGNFTTDDGVRLISLVRNPDAASPLLFLDAKHRLVRFEGSRLHTFLQLQTTDDPDIGVFTFSGEDSVWFVMKNTVQRYSLHDGSLIT